MERGLRLRCAFSTFHSVKHVVYIVSLIVASLSIGCASTKFYTPEDFCKKPANDQMARIILDRESQFTGGGGTFRVTDNDQPIGDIGPGDRLCWDRYPGTAWVSVKASSQSAKTDKSITGERSEMVFKTEANMTYKLITYLIMGEGFVIEKSDTR
jgi:hypothetical protein